jgi:hypothetical protein
VLNWKTVDPLAVYPRPRYRAVSGKHEYTLTPQVDCKGHVTSTSWWHLLALEEAPADSEFTYGYADSLNCRSLDAAKATAQEWESRNFAAEHLERAEAGAEDSIHAVYARSDTA